jgi:hypothetical protein
MQIGDVGSRTTATKVRLDDAERGSDRRERPQRAGEPKTAEVWAASLEPQEMYSFDP